MKKTNQLAKLGLAALMTSIYSTGVSADVINGNATATVLAPLLLVETAAMNFGSVAGGSSAGTVVMDLLGARSTTGGATALASAPGTAGQFTIEGAAAQAFTLTVSASATMQDGSGNSMTVDTFTENGSAVTLSGPGVPDAFQISGTLNVGASQVAGGYTTVGFTPFTVTANYN